MSMKFSNAMVLTPDIRCADLRLARGTPHRRPVLPACISLRLTELFFLDGLARSPSLVRPQCSGPGHRDRSASSGVALGAAKSIGRLFAFARPCRAVLGSIRRLRWTIAALERGVELAVAAAVYAVSCRGTIRRRSALVRGREVCKGAASGKRPRSGLRDDRRGEVAANVVGVLEAHSRDPIYKIVVRLMLFGYAGP